MSQHELSHRIGLSQSTLSRIEQGIHELSLRDALRLQQQLGLRSIEELFGGSPTGKLLLPESPDTG